MATRIPRPGSGALPDMQNAPASVQRGGVGGRHGMLPDTPAVLAALVHARDALGPVKRADADTHLVLSMLLLKLASDRQVDAPATGRVPLDRALLDALRVPAHARFDTLFRQRHAPGNALRVLEALRVFSAANPGPLTGLFLALQLPDALSADETRRDEVVLHLLERMTLPALDFRRRPGIGSTCITDAVEALLERPAVGRRTPDPRHTPAALAWLMAALTAPRANDTVYDPSCRDGSLLLAASRHMRGDGEGHAAARSDRSSLYGQDGDALLCAVARLRLVLHGSGGPQIHAVDAIEHPLVAHGQLQRFDVALACPPLHLTWMPSRANGDHYKRFQHGTAPRQWAHAALVQHTLATLDPLRGRMAIVVPHGVLFRDGEEARIRNAWLDANLVETVIGLPDRLFAGASVATALLVLRKVRADDAVLFIDARGCAAAGTRRPRLGNAAAAALLTLCVERRSVPGVAHLARAEDVAANDGNLSIARYVRPPPTRPAADLATLRARRVALAAEFAAIQQALDAELDALEREFLALG